jgi:ketosteroid isomerase-like protein
LNDIPRALLVASACGLALGACSPKPSADEIRKTLRDDESQLNADYKARDFSRVASHYATDATLVTPGMTMVKEGAGIEAALKRLLADPQLELSFNADKIGVADSGDLAYARGRFTLTVSNPTIAVPISQTGNYINVYRRQKDGSWKAIETVASLATAPAGGGTPR